MKHFGNKHEKPVEAIPEKSVFEKPAFKSFMINHEVYLADVRYFATTQLASDQADQFARVPQY